MSLRSGSQVDGYPALMLMASSENKRKDLCPREKNRVTEMFVFSASIRSKRVGNRYKVCPNYLGGIRELSKSDAALAVVTVRLECRCTATHLPMDPSRCPAKAWHTLAPASPVISWNARATRPVG